MVKRLSYLWLAIGCLVFLCIGAQRPEDDLAEGDRAYRDGDSDAALRHYERALTRSPDPGLVSYHQGVVLAESGQHVEAAAAWMRTLEDAQGMRRLKAAYGEGTALTHVAAGLPGRQAVRALRQALQWFDVVAQEGNTLTDLGSVPEDAKHNRAVAEALLARKLIEPEPPEQDQARDSTENPPNMEELGSGDRQRQPGGGRRGGDGRQEGQPREGNGDSQPGQGNVLPQPDEERLPQISPEEAQRRLDAVLKRLRGPMASTPQRPGVKDW